MLSNNFGSRSIRVGIFSVQQLLSGSSEARSVRTYSSVSARDRMLLSVEARYLQSIKFYIEGLYEVFEDISTLCHKFSCLLIRQSLMHVLIWSFEVREEKDEDFLWVSRNLDKVDVIANLMEVSVKNLARYFNSVRIVPNIHWWRPLFCNDIKFRFLKIAPNYTFSSSHRIKS